MNTSLESAVRLINLTSSGLLAGSLGFGDAVLIPGWERERPRSKTNDDGEPSAYFNAIGPIALASSLALAIGSRSRSAAARTFDALSAASLAGVLGTTMLVTVPINKKLDHEQPIDYPNDAAWSMNRNWSRAHSIRTALGIGAFVFAAASNVMRRR
jgi:hypothetical protein